MEDNYLDEEIIYQLELMKVFDNINTTKDDSNSKEVLSETFKKESDKKEVFLIEKMTKPQPWVSQPWNPIPFSQPMVVEKVEEITNPIILLCQGNLQGFCSMICKDISKSKILIYSESILCHTISKYLDERFFIIGIDAKIEEIICDTLATFRCDICFIYENLLVIIECKYRSDRMNQENDALACIRFRNYVPRMLNYLDNHHLLMAKVTDVVSVGVALGINPLKVTCSTESVAVGDVDRDYYKNRTFLNNVRKGIRRFKKY